MRTALILAGHGSHISPNTAGLVWEYVDMLRARGVADEITACFWKETPHFNQVLPTVTAERVIVVPLFTAAGFFSQEVIPAEMGLTGQATQRDHQTIILTDPIGTHPKIAEVVTRRITDTLQQNNLSADEVTVAIIGHGTPRNSDSRDTTQQQVSLIQAQNLVATVLDAYLDDEPTIPSIYERTVEPTIIAVPFFLAIGSHVLIDVPNALGIDPHQVVNEVNGKRVFYTPPVGTADVNCELVLDLAYSAGLPIAKAEENISAWSGFPQVGQAEFTAYLQAQKELQIGELRVTPHEVAPLNNTLEPQVIQTPAELRQLVREGKYPHPRPLSHGQSQDDLVGEGRSSQSNLSDAPLFVSNSKQLKDVRNFASNSPSSGRGMPRPYKIWERGAGGSEGRKSFRSLATRTDLPIGWQVELTQPEEAFAVIETVYPGVLADWHQWREGQLVTESLPEVSQRQVGMFKNIENLAEPVIERTIHTLCEACIRQPTWFTSPDKTAQTTEFIPCATPCNLWLSQAVRGD